METQIDFRPSPIAGHWYPGDPQQLAETVDSYIAGARLPSIEGEVLAVVAPHAGHRFSGPVAGYAFAALRGRRPDLVAVISPMHHLYSQPLLTSAHAAYLTPLGALTIDQEALQALDEALRDRLGFGVSPVSRDPEHSLEIELPFLQRALAGEFRLLPVMMRDQSRELAHSLGLALAATLQGQEALLVASSDLSHFHDQASAKTLDAEVMRRIEAFDPEGVLAAEAEGVGFACGRGAVAAVLWAARELGADSVQLLHHATSGDVTGDYASVVGYGSAVITRTGKPA